jgi:C1A family cysteine protease
MKTYTKRLMTQHIYNLRRQEDDERDRPLSHSLNINEAVKLPKSVDLRSKCPPIFDQGDLGSCAANVGVRVRMMLTNETTLLSRLYQYYQERVIEGTVGEDAGAQMRDVGKAMFNMGICPESDFPYDVTKFTNKPSPTDDLDALKYKINHYTSVPDIDGIKQVLALKQQPVMAGMDVYASFESKAVAKTGKVPIPKMSERKLGGHAVTIVGYDDTKKWLIVANSWGAGWGDKGYFYLPYDYIIKKFAYDFWIISM